MRTKKTRMMACILWLLTGLLGLTAAKEFSARHASVVRAEISGYDPRHFMYGHYLRFQFIANDANASLKKYGQVHDYYVPEQYAEQLDHLLRARSHVLAVDVRLHGETIDFGDLYIDNEPWLPYLTQHPDAP